MRPAYPGILKLPAVHALDGIGAGRFDDFVRALKLSVAVILLPLPL
jgi:hypothetical protein